jgi:rsbT co-antagonist protein RsbR
MAKGQSRIAGVLKKYEDELVAEWTNELKVAGSGKEGRINEQELFAHAKEFVGLLQQAAQLGDLTNTSRPEWKSINEFLEGISRTRVAQGFTSDQTATFVFSFKKPFFARLRAEFGRDADALAEETWAASELLDKMGLLTIRAFQKSREDVINRQQEEMLELSTPVVKMWDGILALPMIGTLDSARTQIVMESLLQRIVRHRLGNRHHRYHGRADGRYACRAAFAQNRDGDSLDGRRLHHQRRAPANCANDCALGRRSARRDDEGHAG